MAIAQLKLVWFLGHVKVSLKVGRELKSNTITNTNTNLSMQTICKYTIHNVYIINTIIILLLLLNWRERKINQQSINHDYTCGTFDELYTNV